MFRCNGLSPGTVQLRLWVLACGVLGGTFAPTAAATQPGPQTEAEGSHEAEGPPDTEGSHDAEGPHDAEGRPIDPNDLPFMDAPNGQRQPRTSSDVPELTLPFSRRRRVQLTISPMYAASKLTLLGRPDQVRHGFGFSFEADIQLIKWMWFRAGVSHTVHPMPRTVVLDEDDEPVETAAAGMLHATYFSGGVALAIDLGRFLPLLDVGIGALRVATPQGLFTGQRGLPCNSDGSCDTGLVCASSGMCEVSLLPTVHAGVGVDVLVGQHLTLGFLVRYYAPVSAIADIPLYLAASVRAGVRF